jgi:undecaprenyl-phosphate 4-deoxy-4-formamido-L-arabinose transferase
MNAALPVASAPAPAEPRPAMTDPAGQSAASPVGAPSAAPTLSVVVPMYNEERNLPSLFARLLAVLRGLDVSWEVVCVDDGSRDATARLVRAQQASEPRLVLVGFARNFGQHAAVTAGFAQSRGRWIITLDADLQNPPEEIPRLLACFQQGHDLINTFRIGRQDTWFRKRASAITNQLVRRMSGIRLSDFGCMLRGYSREIADAVVACREYKTFIPALATLFARDPIEVGVGHAARAEGVSNYSLLKLISLQLDLITSFSVSPLRLLFVVGVVLAIVGTLFGLLLLVLRFLYGAAWAADGTLTVLGILMLFTGAQFFAFGLLGEYIGRIFQQVRLREPFVIRAVERVGEAVQHPGPDRR